MDQNQLRAIFFEALPRANDADWAAFGEPIPSVLASGAGAESLKDHLIVDGSWTEEDAQAIVSKLQERNAFA